MGSSEDPAQPMSAGEADPGLELTCQALDSIEAIGAAQWDALHDGDNPFLHHDFLAALERNRCVGDHDGWRPHHLLVYQGDVLVGASPMYLKSHSYGEFVFDWGWADAYERNGMRYYPKLLCAVPFTPVPGPRMLVAPGADRDIVVRALVSATVQITEQADLSSAHWLFTDPRDSDAMDGLPLLHRHGCQFHWHNPGYRDFQDYLDALSSKRRKQVRKERREAAQAPVTVEVLHGDELSESDIAGYHALYCSTYDRKWGYPSLSLDFFLEVAESMPRSLLLMLARRDGRCVAGAHLFAGADALFGRNWGCSEQHRSLHFEICYYRSIDLCIEDSCAL